MGYFPIASGTVASLAALFLYFLIKENNLIYFSVTVLLLLLGFWSSSRAKESFRGEDPHEIVIDEFSSMLLVYFFVPFSPKLLVAGFLIFRALDIFKLPPIKNMERLPRGYGIMLDDIACAIFTNLILHLLRFVIV